MLSTNPAVSIARVHDELLMETLPLTDLIPAGLEPAVASLEMLIARPLSREESTKLLQKAFTEIEVLSSLSTENSLSIASLSLKLSLSCEGSESHLVYHILQLK